MRSPEELASRILIGLVRALSDLTLHAYKRGVSEVIVPGKRKPLAPLEARKHFVSWLDHRRVRGSVDDDLRNDLLKKPRDAGPTSTVEALNGFEVVETDLWIARIRPTLPSFTVATPAMWSYAHSLTLADVESWWKKVRPRPRSELEEVNRQAAAWRWRAEVAGYVLPSREYRPEMRRYIGRLRELVPLAARFAAKQRWFKPDRNDFPIYADPVLVYTDNLDWTEREELLGLARARSGALRAMLDVGGDMHSGCDLGANEAWRIMAVDSNLPEHPQFPY